MKRNFLPATAIIFFMSLSCSNMTFQNERYAGYATSENTLGTETSWIAPYTVVKFQSVLNKCKLQCPDSDTSIENGIALQTAASPYFHVASSNKMEFYQAGDHNRTELRDMIEWKTSTTDARSISARLKIHSVSPDLEEVTVLQIHDSGTFPNKPLLRITWLKNKNNLSNHIWSIRRTSVSNETYAYTDLGAPENQFFKIHVSVITNKLTITYEGMVKVNNAGLSYWKNLGNYFKAGAYLQSEGYAYIRFDALEFK